MRLGLWGLAAALAATLAIASPAAAGDFGFSVRYDSGGCGSRYYSPARSYSTYYAPRSYYYGHPVRSYSYSYARPSFGAYSGGYGPAYYPSTHYYSTSRVISTPHVQSYAYRYPARSYSYRQPARSYSYRSLGGGTRVYYRR